MSYRGLGTVTGQWAKIVAPGFRYQLTDEDILWAGRAAAHEGSHGAVLWAWAQRYTLPEMRQFGTLTEMMRAHSQPINPKWVRGGRCCPTALPDCTSPCSTSHPCPCSEAVLTRRDRAVTMPWSMLSSSLRNTVTKWATAQLPNPIPRAVDFAMRGSRVSSGLTKLFTIGDNDFFATSRTLSWDPNRIVMQKGEHIVGVGGSNIIVFAIAALIAGASYFVVRSRRTA